jgi:hypothetical protein
LLPPSLAGERALNVRGGLCFAVCVLGEGRGEDAWSTRGALLWDPHPREGEVGANNRGTRRAANEAGGLASVLHTRGVMRGC